MEKYNSNEYCCLGGSEVMRTGGQSVTQYKMMGTRDRTAD